MLQRGQRLLEEAEVDCGDIEERLGHLQSSWDTLREAAAGRLQRLRDASEAQQYYLDAGEAEAWVSEQELYVISDETPKVGSGWGCQAGCEVERKSEGTWGEGSQWGTSKSSLRGVKLGGGLWGAVGGAHLLRVLRLHRAHAQPGAPSANLDLLQPRSPSPFGYQGLCAGGDEK